MSANWSLPGSAEKLLRFACYTPPYEKYIHLFAICSDSIDVFALFFSVLDYLTAAYHAFLRWVHHHAFRTVIFGMVRYGSLYSFVCTHIPPSVRPVHSCNLWS